MSEVDDGTKQTIIDPIAGSTAIDPDDQSIIAADSQTAIDASAQTVAVW